MGVIEVVPTFQISAHISRSLETKIVELSKNTNLGMYLLEGMLSISNVTILYKTFRLLHYRQANQGRGPIFCKI